MLISSTWFNGPGMGELVKMYESFKTSTLYVNIPKEHRSFSHEVLTREKASSDTCFVLFAENWGFCLLPRMP